MFCWQLFIDNGFEAGGQNVNVRNGRARAHAARPQARQRFKFLYFAEKWIFSESIFIGLKIKKKFCILRLIVKEQFRFEVLSVTDVRARGALLVTLRCKSSMYPKIVNRFWKRMVLPKQMTYPKIGSLKLSLWLHQM